MKKLIRFLVYVGGLAILSLGVVINTKTGLGVSPINSVPFSISQITGTTLGLMTVIVYLFCIAIQAILLKKVTIKMLIQVPFSVLFGTYVNLFNSAMNIPMESLTAKIIWFLIAIVCISLGVYLSVNMNIVPNAPDALAKAIGETLKKDMGFGKNLLDIICVVASCSIGLIFAGKLIGIGVGSVATALLIGRCIKLWGKVIHPVERIGKW